MRACRPLRTMLQLASLALMIISWAREVQACVICVPYPKDTHADSLLESDTIVIAREDPAEPFSFAIIKVLKGATNDQPIELFLNSQTRRRLNLNPDDVVVLYRRNAESQWSWLAYADIEYQRIISIVLANADGWRVKNGSQERVAFFARLLTSSHPTIREQAYLEVGRVPYTWIKQIADAVPREEMRRFLADWRLIEWHRLYILMLGNSGHPEDRAYIREQFESAARFGLSRRLSAWTVAFVESHPETAIEEIEKLYFRRAGRKSVELEAVMQGLSVLTADAGVLVGPRVANYRRRVTRSYAALIDRYPEMAGFVARDLTTWKRRALVDRLSRVALNRKILDPGSEWALDYYLSVANRFPSLGEIN